MSPQEKLPSPENLPSSVIDVHELLASNNIPHAFGGAIAANFYTSRQPTADIDVNLFIPLDKRSDDIAVITPILKMLNPELTLDEARLRLEQIREDDQTVINYKDTRVDLFFSFSEFHDEVAKRVKHVDYKGAKLPIISPEDLIIFKVMFSLYPERREHDWADIEGIIRDQPDLDAGYVYKWLGMSFIYSDHKDWINDRLAQNGLPEPDNKA